MWLFIIVFAIMIFTRLDDLIELFKSKDPNYQETKEKEQIELLNHRAELVERLHSLIGLDCQIESQTFYLMSLPSKLEVTIQAVDQEWVKLIVNQRKPFELVVKIEEVTSVSRIV
ncbi:hypothetical protein GIY09_00905 [Aerococcaceae bacterium WS4759]|uniref:Uncharacterized protein n=1 Tax=Fundicoccus ignavus TaxID=2664442 RepID=A0A6I2GGQ3_9LACT|nr:hypothetical protein [Fundicoccus ignavus]MRI84459.1 hypothetical protein [Fundicoccus ignavus]